MLIAPIRLKIQTSNLTNMFPGTVRTYPLNFVQNGRGYAEIFGR